MEWQRFVNSGRNIDECKVHLTSLAKHISRKYRDGGVLHFYLWGFTERRNTLLHGITHPHTKWGFFALRTFSKGTTSVRRLVIHLFVFFFIGVIICRGAYILWVDVVIHFSNIWHISLPYRYNVRSHRHSLLSYYQVHPATVYRLRYFYSVSIKKSRWH